MLLEDKPHDRGVDCGSVVCLLLCTGLSSATGRFAVYETEADGKVLKHWIDGACVYSGTRPAARFTNDARLCRAFHCGRCYARSTQHQRAVDMEKADEIGNRQFRPCSMKAKSEPPERPPLTPSPEIFSSFRAG